MKKVAGAAARVGLDAISMAFWAGLGIELIYAQVVFVGEVFATPNACARIAAWGLVGLSAAVAFGGYMVTQRRIGRLWR